MASRIKTLNIILGTILVASLIGTTFEAYQFWKISNLNSKLKAGKVVSDEAYPLHSKFSAAYFQGINLDFKHAVQTYGQLLDANTKKSTLTEREQSLIQFNIGNNLFQSGMSRRVNEDGTLKEEAFYSFSQAKIAYEQSLRMDPSLLIAKFNLSLLNSVLPLNMKSGVKNQSAVELSNLPVGLP